MSQTTTPYSRWRALRACAFAAHVAAVNDGERARAIAALAEGMKELRSALDDDDREVFDATLRRDYETLLIAEATVDGVICEARLRRIAMREIAAGRMTDSDPLRRRAVSADAPG